MPSKNLILKVQKHTFEKESWFAPFKSAIEGLTAEQAEWIPDGEAAKSIWQNVNHLIYYKERLVAKLEDREWEMNLDGDETFFLTEQSSDDADWNEVVRRALKINSRLQEVLSGLSEEKLASIEDELFDIFLHDAYHTGQIIQLRKMQGSWPSGR